MSSDEIVTQLQQIVITLKRTIEASAQLAERVDAMEQQSGEKLGVLTSLQGGLQVLLDRYQTQAIAQDAVNDELRQRMSMIEARLTTLENRAA
jgi:hypothetical protein